MVNTPLLAHFHDEFVYADQYLYLTLETDCARLEFKIHESPAHQYEVLTINVVSKAKCARFDKCTIAAKSLSTNASQHYKCLYDRIYECILSPNDITLSNRNNGGTPQTLSEAYLVINQLEFELDGDPKKISQEQFSKPQREC